VGPAVFEPHRCWALVGVGLVSFLIWLAVLFNIAPHRLITYVAFFTPLWIFVASFCAAGLYLFAGTRPELATNALGNSVRRGALVASLLVAELALVAARRWTLVGLLVFVAVIGVIELISWARADGAAHQTNPGSAARRGEA
jgi:hypothetical protein